VTKETELKYNNHVYYGKWSRGGIRGEYRNKIFQFQQRSERLSAGCGRKRGGPGGEYVKTEKKRYHKSYKLGILLLRWNAKRKEGGLIERVFKDHIVPISLEFYDTWFKIKPTIRFNERWDEGKGGISGGGRNSDWRSKQEGHRRPEVKNPHG